MAMPNFGSRKVFWSTIVGLLVLGGGSWAMWSGSGSAKSPTGLSAELSYASLQKQAADNLGKVFDTIRENVRREDLTDEQRRELRGNMRRVMRTALTQRVDEYWNADDAQRDAVLDRHIDDLQARMAEFQKRRDERQRERSADGSVGQESRPRRPQPTQEQRRQRSESRDPDETARAALYFNNLQARMGERGISMPGGGGRGGPGGGGRRGGP